MTELSMALQSLISRAATTLPANTGEAARFETRFSAATGATVILADTSGSMVEPAGGRAKIEHLREAVRDCWSEVPGSRLFRFDSIATEIAGPEQLTEPSGGTALHLALEAIRELRPARTVVISDGRPDNEAAALAAAAKLTGRIDVLYCGPDSDASAIAFLRSLARAGCGRCEIYDVVRRAKSERPRLPLRELLGLPAPGGAQ